MTRDSRADAETGPAEADRPAEAGERADMAKPSEPTDTARDTRTGQPSGGQTADRARLAGPAGLLEAPRRIRRAGAGRGQTLALVAVLGILLAIGTATSPHFLNTSNLLLILTDASIIGVVSIGMTFVIISGGIDLSVGSIISLAAVWCTTGATQSFGLIGMLFCAMAVALVCGVLNGVLIAYGGLVSLIVTIAGLASFRGLATQISGGEPQVVEVGSFGAIATTNILGVPMLVVIFAAVSVAGWLLLNRTTFGRHVYAIGGNQEAARLAGIDVRRQRMLVFVLSGACCGIAAIMLTARAHTGAPTHGEFYELDVIAAVILGGTLLSGGRGTLIGSVLGVLVFATVTNIFAHNDLQSPIQQVAKGVIIVAAVLLQRRTNRAET